jgi:1-acyl-sn-glycerol-3-phosphate acyltransferase
MSEVRRFFIGILTFFAILVILIFAVTLLTVVNIPRIIPNKNFKVSLGSLSNTMGSATVASITAALRILHKLEWDFQIPKGVDTDTWYLAMSNHQSWADIFILLAAGHKKNTPSKVFYEKGIAMDTNHLLSS